MVGVPGGNGWHDRTLRQCVSCLLEEWRTGGKFGMDLLGTYVDFLLGSCTGSTRRSTLLSYHSTVINSTHDHTRHYVILYIHYIHNFSLLNHHEIQKLLHYICNQINRFYFVTISSTTLTYITILSVQKASDLTAVFPVPYFTPITDEPTHTTMQTL